MKIKLLAAVGIAITVGIVGCDSSPSSPRGFSLPEGNADMGKTVFLKHQCTSCHSIEGINSAELDQELSAPLALGGESTRVTTYAELVTSIINPSHKVARGFKVNGVDSEGQSKMRNVNDVMTVAELIDLVAFLQPHYKVKPATYTHYGQYRKL
ncbi:c-type cytochrome [Aliiglaciecola sp. LCG003]|uniref:c-type cytochrome n=1 Tax=Aliiglaciecola sp. LCG003 TaxID=3053655 RepID=UPI002572B090|nr:c-type cytochrome [Aliiglaciecola sp. LCG003]WJG10788.1 c-type cytochrome [Aliiglaciecola sp. LCG003]